MSVYGACRCCDVVHIEKVLSRVIPIDGHVQPGALVEEDSEQEWLCSIPGDQGRINSQPANIV